MSTAIMLKNVRLTFPVLWKAEEFEQGDGRPRYSASLLIVPGSENDKLVRSTMNDELAIAFPKPGLAAKKLAEFLGSKIQNCYKDGDLKNYDGYEGMWVLTAHRREKDGKPLILGQDLDNDPDSDRFGRLRELKEKDGIPYSGCYVNAKVDIWTQTGTNEGIRATLSTVQFCGHGDAFAGAARPKDDGFEPIAEGADAEDLA